MCVGLFPNLKHHFGLTNFSDPEHRGYHGYFLVPEVYQWPVPSPVKSIPNKQRVMRETLNLDLFFSFFSKMKRETE